MNRFLRRDRVMKRRLAPGVHGACLRPRAQQGGDNRGFVGVSGRLVERGLVGAGPCVDVRARVRQGGYQLGTVSGFVDDVQRSPAQPVPGAGVGSELQQPVDNIGDGGDRWTLHGAGRPKPPARLHDPKQRRRSALARRVDVRARLHERLEHLQALKADYRGRKQRGVAVRVDSVDIGAGLQEEVGDFERLVPGRPVQRGSAGLVARLQLGPRIEQQRHDGGLRDRPPMERGHATVAAGVHIRAPFQAAPDRIGIRDVREHPGVPMFAARRVRDPPPAVACRPVRPEFKQPGDDGGIGIGPRTVERRVALHVPRIHVRAGRHHGGDNPGVAIPGCGQMQRRIAPCVPGIDVRAGPQKHGEDPGVPVAQGGHMQGSAAFDRHVHVPARLDAGRDRLGRGLGKELDRGPVFTALLRGGRTSRDQEGEGNCAEKRSVAEVPHGRLQRCGRGLQAFHQYMSGATPGFPVAGRSAQTCRQAASYTSARTSR